MKAETCLGGRTEGDVETGGREQVCQSEGIK